MRIGITERGDPSIDFSWVNKINNMDGTIIITKNLTDKVIDCAKPYLDKIIFHVTCTGYGKTIVEPNIPVFTKQLDQAEKLILLGVPYDRVVIRIDPIIPTPKGIKRAKMVFEEAIKRGFTRYRVSVMDVYSYIRDGFKALGIEPPYGDFFTASNEMFKNLNNMLRELKSKNHQITINSCAENKLTEAEASGCVGLKDIELLGLSTQNVDSSGYQRKGCLCCSAKTELLSEKKQCPYKCIYCYWK